MGHVPARADFPVFRHSEQNGAALEGSGRRRRDGEVRKGDGAGREDREAGKWGGNWREWEDRGRTPFTPAKYRSMRREVVPGRA